MRAIRAAAIHCGGRAGVIARKLRSYKGRVWAIYCVVWAGAIARKLRSYTIVGVRRGGAATA
ncbi:hypothetical protein PCL1606_21150 [Pseudomonas chlororaphis]|uniref:Uncharacterized protein n=1 Tax=Pseudomonas chlororaphis TaxID=587753 RepID=A0A0D5XWU6_9PSED|nr:hypothetical protein PCL1606_21150 [Pseudomonas chlororaphis]